jgi:Ca2+-binding RTX toxin-like protein
MGRWIAGLGGNDRIRSLGGNDIVCGGAGNDELESVDGVANNDNLGGFLDTDTCLSDPDPEENCEMD